MRIAYLSDLHLECDGPDAIGWSDFLAHALSPARGAELIVLAGDIACGADAITVADTIASHMDANVVLVPGNHESYGADMTRQMALMREAAWRTDGRVQLLTASMVRFWFAGRQLAVLGCTLWTDYAISGNITDAMHEAETRMHDHQAIGLNGAPFLPAAAAELHARQRGWLERQVSKLRNEHPQPDFLIVTHHAPCHESIGPRVRALSYAYASDLSAEIARWQPKAWIHGHTHLRHDSQVSGCRVLSAPRGYHGERTGAYTCGVLEL